MEEFTSEKRIREGNETEESVMNNMKSESDNRKEDKFSEDDGKNQQQTDMKTRSEEYGGFPSSSRKEESIIGKRLREDNEINESRVKKKKSEADNKKDGKSKENGDKNKLLKYERTRKEEEEAHFLRLFTKVLNAIINEKHVDDEDISESITDMKYSFLPSQTFHETDFTQWKNICAFLYRYASHGAGFARNRILNAIQNCQVVANVLQKPYLKIICLGSGAGNDAVGLCSALSELQFPKSLKLTLIDKFEEWSSCIELAKRFIEEENFGKVSELFQNTGVELSFIQIDLPGDPESDKKYFEILGEADVIVMSKFLTSLDRSNYGEHEKTIIKVNAFLIFLVFIQNIFYAEI